MNKRDYITGLIRLGAKLETAGKLDCLTIDALHKLRRIEKSHRRLCEYLCNYSDDDGTVYDRLEAMETKAAQLAGSVGLFVETQRDPRGLTVKLATSKESLESGGNLNVIFE